jgi:leader peptidase (prepilin peptidase)/N-methyltransferase
MISVIVLAALGWFLGAAIWIVARAQADHRPLFSGPVCEACGAPRSPAAWFPLYGFGAAWQCQACHERQSFKRPLFELFTAAYFGIAAATIEDNTRLIGALLFAVPLLIILLVDAWTRLIHTNIIMLGTALGFFFAAADGFKDLGKSVLGLVIGLAIFVGFFVMARVIYRSVKVVPFGLGDVYLAAMIGAMVRWPLVLSSLVLGIFLAGVIGVLLLVSKRASRRTAIPYGPYLCIGALVVMLQQF